MFICTSQNPHVSPYMTTSRVHVHRKHRSHFQGSILSYMYIHVDVFYSCISICILREFSCKTNAHSMHIKTKKAVLHMLNT